jgi:hypothetical protein
MRRDAGLDLQRGGPRGELRASTHPGGPLTGGGPPPRSPRLPVLRSVRTGHPGGRTGGAPTAAPPPGRSSFPAPRRTVRPGPHRPSRGRGRRQRETSVDASPGGLQGRLSAPILAAAQTLWHPCGRLDPRCGHQCYALSGKWASR